MIFQLAVHGSPEFDSAVALRREVLRWPLGLDFSPEELKLESIETHLVTIEAGRVVGTVSFRPISAAEVKMRQFAIAEPLQGQGLGHALMAFGEGWARRAGYLLITLHARRTAVRFYERAGYQVEGAEFTEVGLPHHRMLKPL